MRSPIEAEKQTTTATDTAERVPFAERGGKARERLRLFDDASSLPTKDTASAGNGALAANEQGEAPGGEIPTPLLEWANALAETPDLLKVPDDEAQRILRTTVRLVADIPKGSSPDVVWVLGANELLVHTADIGLSCQPGQVTITLPVACDQLRDGATVQIPFAVGTDDAPSGLVMSTLDRPAGPALVVDVWAGSLTAFAWEALLHLAEQQCAAAGRDGAGRPLVPGYIGAGRGVLFVQPITRQATAARP